MCWRQVATAWRLQCIGRSTRELTRGPAAQVGLRHQRLDGPPASGAAWPDRHGRVAAGGVAAAHIPQACLSRGVRSVLPQRIHVLGRQSALRVSASYGCKLAMATTPRCVVPSPLALPGSRPAIEVENVALQALAIAFRTLGLPLNATAEHLRAAGLSEDAVANRLRQLRRQACRRPNLLVEDR